MNPPSQLGKKRSSETRLKMSLAKLGRKRQPRSEETRRKISEGHKGLKMHPNTYEALKLVRNGNKYNVGKKYSIDRRQKMSESHRGEKSHLWRGGITPVNQLVRRSLEIKLWRKECFERDSFTCQVCGQSGGRLVVHHINNFADFPELRTVISNGITLCSICHSSFHKKYGVKNNTLEQLQELVSAYK